MNAASEVDDSARRKTMWRKHYEVQDAYATAERLFDNPHSAWDGKTYPFPVGQIASAARFAYDKAVEEGGNAYLERRYASGAMWEWCNRAVNGERFKASF